MTLYVLHRKPYKAPGHTSRATTDQSLKDLRQLPLVGFAISKKVLKSACKRNRAKRRAREAYRLLRSQLLKKGEDLYNLKRWYALVFVISPNILTLDFGSVERSLEDCLSKAQKKFISGKNLAQK